MARIIAQIILSGSQVIGRAFARALKQEIEASQEAARMRGGRPSSQRDPRSAQAGITLDEAKRILDLSDPIDPKKIDEQYQKLFNANESSKGGSFYLQSKIYRAKERIDMEVQNTTKGPDLDK